MKRLLWLFLLLPRLAWPAVNYWIDQSEFITDPSSGTLNLNGTNVGRVKGVQYTLKSSDTVTGQMSDFTTFASTTPYLNNFPSVTATRNFIQNDAINKSAKTYLDGVRRQKPDITVQPINIPVDQVSPGISTQTVTLP